MTFFSTAANLSENSEISIARKYSDNKYTDARTFLSSTSPRWNACNNRDKYRRADLADRIARSRPAGAVPAGGELLFFAFFIGKLPLMPIQQVLIFAAFSYHNHSFFVKNRPYFGFFLVVLNTRSPSGASGFIGDSPIFCS
jgi:hypothetical protein